MILFAHSGHKSVEIFTMVLVLAFSFLPALPARAAEDPFKESRQKKELPQSVAMVLDELLATKDPSKPVPSPAMLSSLIDFMTSDYTTFTNTYPPSRDEGTGFFWKDTLNIPFKDAIRYLYNPKIPTEAIYPSAIHRGIWLPESEIVKMEKPLWDHLANLSKPVIVRGAEKEEITPDDFSGSYYDYILDRLIILLQYENKPMVISVTWQRDTSSVGRKGGFLGEYDDWNFIYTEEEGATAKAVSWAKTYMYGTASVTIIYPDGDKTRYTIIKWLKAGWSGVNVVERKHLKAGAERSLEGLKAVLESPHRPSPEALEKKFKEFSSMSREQLCSLADPYCKTFAQKAQDNDKLSGEAFKRLLEDGSYVNNIPKSDLVSILLVNYIKERIGKNVLGEGESAGKTSPASTAADPVPATKPAVPGNGGKTE